MESLIQPTIDAIAQASGQAINTLTPYGHGILFPLAVTAVILFGVSVASGNGAGMLQLTFIWSARIALATLTLTVWPLVVGGSVDTAHQVLQALGFHGVGSLFGSAGSVASRVLVDMVRLDISSAEAAVSSAASSVAAPFCALIVLVGLSFPAILATLAEIELMIGATIAPILLPFLAFEITHGIGWAAIVWLISSTVRIISFGAVSFVMAQAISATVSIGGVDQAMALSDIWKMILLSVISVGVGLMSGRLASTVMHGAAGAMSWSTVTGTASTSAGTGSVVVKGATGAAGAVMAAGAALGAAVGGSGGAKVSTSSGTGNPFAGRG